MLQCIRDFDEKLCLKANKMSLDKVEKDSKETYYTKVDQRKFQVQNTLETQKRIQENA